MLTHSPVPAPLRDFLWTLRALQRGTAIFREGDPVEHVFLLEAGLIKLSRHLDSQRKMIVRLVRPGELIADCANGVVGHQRNTAEALSDGLVRVMSREDFQIASDSTPSVIAWIAQQVEQRLAELESRMALISYARVEIRILSLLADLAETTMKAAGLPPENLAIPLSQSEIGQLIGATRETASTTLNSLERRGMLRLGRRHIEVCSLEAIRTALQADNRAVGAHA